VRGGFTAIIAYLHSQAINAKLLVFYFGISLAFIASLCR